MKPVLVISDTHYHNFSQYSEIGPNGLNSRLGDIIRATLEAAKELKRRGGRVIVHCGDVFHVRGSLAPSVLNPVVKLYEALIKDGFEVHMISGNHDLETDNAADMSSSVSALKSAGVQVYNEDTVVPIEGYNWRFLPWYKDLNALRAKIKMRSGIKVDRLVLHAPLNEVIVGVPDHGLSPEDFDRTGVNIVFCGHYHNHKAFVTPDGFTSIYSVGALTHQNWGDTESRAGYIIVGSSVNQVETSAPKYRKINVVDLEDVPADYYADNYIKVVGGSFTDPSEIQAIKDELLLKGAKAVVVEGLVKRPVATRGTTTTTAPTIETILGEYLDRTYPGEGDVKMEALEILRMVSE